MLCLLEASLQGSSGCPVGGPIGFHKTDRPPRGAPYETYAHLEGSARGTCARAKAVVPRPLAPHGRVSTRRGQYINAYDPLRRFAPRLTEEAIP
ncbi:hypothetical protein GCM10020000_27910 [Streptomyces olivoverticillatus]